MSGPGSLAGLSREQRAALFERLRKRKEAAGAPRETVPRRPPDLDPIPASFAQERFWFLDRLLPGDPAYNVPQALGLTGDLSPAVLTAVFGEVARRHEVLRTTFAERAGRPVQVIAPPAPAGAGTLPLIDLSALAAARRAAELRRLGQEEIVRPFDLARGPLFRATLVRLEPAGHGLFLVLHHSVADGWSLGVLVREVSALYAAHAAGRPSPLAELPVQYADFAVWQRGWLAGGELERQLAYWRRRLAGSPAALPLPLDRPRPASPGHRGGQIEWLLPADLALDLARLARGREATPYMVFLAALQALLSRLTGEEDVPVGSPIANRTRTEVEPLIGPFVNTLVMRGDLAGDPTLGDLLTRVRAATLEAYAHQDLPFEQLVEELRPERQLAVSPLFQVLLVVQNAPLEEARVRGLALAHLPLATRVSQFDLAVTFQETPEGMLADLVYDAELFDPPTARRLADQLETLLRSLAADPGLPLSAVPLLSAPELQQVVREWNDTARAPGGPALAHGIVERQAALTPDAVAVEHGEERLSYAGLLARARQLAGVLRGVGVGPDAPVALWTGRSLALPVGVLAVLEAGGACLPLDPSYPAERLARMVADAHPRVLLTDEEMLAGLPAGLGEGLEVVTVGDEGIEISGVSPVPENLAYVLYTSGSTGHPKGVALPHRALANLSLWAAEVRPEPARTLQFSPLGFDVSFEEMFSTWAVGGTLVLMPEEARQDPAALLAFLAAKRIGRLFLPFVALQQLAEAARDGGAAPPALREVVTAGEQLRITPAVAAFFQHGVRLFNEYGPTETHATTAFPLAGPAASWPPLPPIGRPIANHRALLLDRGLRPVPPGVAGELCVGGAGLARGYLGRPDLTAERFVPDPAGGEPGARLYRTGDLARWLANGDLEYLGRTDHQVKVRGYRVEPGEVEAAVNALPGVRAAAVVARRDGAGGARLVAYVAWEGEPAEAGLREALRATLPAPMVPTAFVSLDGLPLTPSGKVDRRALSGPAFAPQAPDGSSGAEPATATERELAALWREVLGIERVGAGDDFFDLGGHSLLAVQVLSRLRARLGVDLPVRVMFEAPTLAALARRADEARPSPVGGGRLSGLTPEQRAAAFERLRRRKTGAEASAAPPAGIPRRPPDLDPVPASFAQERLWFLDRLHPGNPAYNVPDALRIVGETSPALLGGILGEVVRRHEALRTTFEERAGRPVQIVSPPGRWRLPLADLSALPADPRWEEARRLALEEADRPFDLRRGPLLRGTLLKLGEADHALLLTMHHIVSDGWSMGVLVNEITALWGAALAGRPSPLPKLAIQYADFAVWQREWLRDEVLETQLSYWRERLTGAAPLALPTDRPRPAFPSHRGGETVHRFGPDFDRELARFARASGATPFMVLLAGFQALLGRASGQDDLSVGTPIANRNRAEIEPLIGLFVNTLVMRADLGGDPAFGELLARARQSALDAYTHQDLPFDQLVQELRPERRLSMSPLFQVLFALQNAPAGRGGLPGLSFERLELPAGATRFDLELHAWETPAGLAGHLYYSTDLFDAPTILRLAGQLEILLRSAMAEPAARLSALPLLAPGERHQVVVEWNDTAAAYPSEASIPELFAAVAVARPGEVAVAQGDRRLTYGELRERAWSLARRLVAAGLRPEERVAVRAERSPDLVVAMLGILRAGGAYLPLDPAYPPERLAWMAADAGASPLLPLEGGDAVDQALPEVPPGALAYVMYTSGSTGAPKGVAVTHRNVVRLVRGAGYADLGPEQVWLQYAPAAFDASTLEIWAPLLNGGRVVLFPGRSGSLAELARVIERHGVTSAWLTAGLFHEMVDGNPEGLRPLRQLLTGGDVVSAGHARQALENHPGLTLIDGYGPTENTTFTTCQRLTDPGQVGESVPIGRPVSNTRVHVLDRGLQPAAVGVWGELFAGGDGVARGYLGRPELTAERFLPDPWSAEPGARMYRTGDLVCLRPDGELEFQGRLDGQVKVRGFRVETGEIEAALLACPGVSRAAVAALGEPGRKSLAAWWVGEATEEEIRAALRDRLPEPLIPTFFVPLAELPLTPNGKVDRAALPRPDLRRAGSGAPPRTPAEAALAALWREVLEVEAVGREDDFFALGGHSLLATRLVSRMRETFGVEVPLRTVFETPTVAALAAWIEPAPEPAPAGGRLDGLSREQRARLFEEVRRRREKGAPPERIPRRPPGFDPLPASFAQERLWFLDRLEPGNTAFNMGSSLRLRGRLDAGALERALNEVVRRHESLRTTFVEADGRPAQRIAPVLRVPLPLVDLAALPEALREEEAGRVARASLASPFDLEAGPLLRASLLRLAPDLHAFVLEIHHIVTDGWSAGVMDRELIALYEAFAAGRPSPLSPLPLQYPDFALWQREWLRGETLEAQLAYWRGKLGGSLPPLDLPTDRPRPAVQTFRGGGGELALSGPVAEALRRLSRDSGASLFMTLLAAFKILLSRLAGQDDVIVGSPIAGRRHSGTEELIGFFLNSLALRTSTAGNPSFRELLERVRETTLGAYSHQDIPFEALLVELKPERDLSRTPVFQVFFNLLNLPGAGGRLPDLEVEPGPAPEPESKFDLTFYVAEIGEGIRFDLVYNADLFDAARMEELLRQYRRVLETVAADPGRRIGDIPLATPEAAARLPDPLQPLGMEWPGAVHELFLEAARRHPEHAAVTDPQGSWTYGELAEAALRLAARLRQAGLEPGDRVAVWAHRSAPVAWAVMGVLAAGGAFVMLDPAYPAARLVEILRLAGPRAWVALADAGAPPEEIEELLAAWEEEGRLLGRAVLPAGGPEGARRLLASLPLAGEPVSAGPDDIAFVAFTSGSTGVPKGILGRHGPLSHFLPWQRERFGLTPEDRYSLLSGLAHDPLQRDLFTSLCTGATLCAPDPTEVFVPGRLAAWAARQGITVAHLTPAMGQVLTEPPGVPDDESEAAQIPSLRFVLLVGDVLTRLDVDRLRRLAPGVTCVNLYGSTETQRAVGYHVVDPGEGAAGQRSRQVLPLGRGMKDVQILIVNPAERLAGVGEVGEIWMRSPHLAGGYLGDEALTRERFRINPFTGLKGDRVYRTGDLGRYLPNGEAVFVGRADNQVKLRGFRIETGEIEATLGRLEGVRESVVVVREDGGDRHLAAYVVPEPGAAPGLAGRVRPFLAARLPEYMVPAAVVELAALPLTPNGKVDRRALPAPRRQGLEGGGAPRNPVEEVLAGLWADLLRLDRVGVRDDFFELGGHSLLATQLVSRLRSTFGAEVSLRQLFENPALEDLAALVAAQGGSEGEAIPRRPPGLDPVPASFAQERLWFLDRLAPANAGYHIPKALRLLGDVSPALLEGAIAAVVRRHESLRTTFAERDGQPVQVVAPPGPWTLPRVDLSALPPAARELEAHRLAREEARRPFDLARGPLLRAALLGLGDGQALLLTLHHIVSDGWSMGVLVQELTALYVAAALGEPADLPGLPIQYPDFAVWQRGWLTGERMERQIDYWRRRLAGTPDLELPTDRPRSSIPAPQGGRVWLGLSEELGRGLADLSRRQGATLFMALFAGFHALLARYSGQEDFAIGSGVANRTRAETEPLIGFFVNALALRAGLPGDPTFLDLLASVRRTALEAYGHQDLPFERLVEELRPERQLSRNPIFQASIALHNMPEGAVRPLPGVAFEPLETEPPGAVFDLEAHFREAGGRLLADLAYRSDLFDEATVRRLAGHLERLLAGAVEDPSRRLSELPLLPEAERHQVLLEWNDTCLEPEPFHGMAALVEVAARRDPGATALAFQGREISYAEMDRRAGRLAALLAALGAGPEILVGLHVERSPEMVIGALAVLKAGAAYVPLDPAYPEKRLARVVAETGMHLVLTRGGGEIPWAGEALAIPVDHEPEGALPAPRPTLAPENTAYVIYTSGSTGVPKGVPISQAGLVNMVRWQARTYGLGPGERMAQVMAVGFDAAVGEIWPALAAGAGLHIVDEETRLSPDGMLAWLAAERIGVCVLPTALGELVLERAIPPGLRLRTLLVGGDRLKRYPSAGLPFALANNYGPTEAAMVATWEIVEPAPDPHRPPAIGRPVDNARVLVLDRSLQPLPMGIPGELALGGVGLSRGYLQRPDLTAERFVPDPYPLVPGDRLYRTGDRVRLRPDGRLDFLERIDQQVKIRGFRIELGEIERALERHPEVGEAAVVAREDGAAGARLVAYVAPGGDREGAEDLAHVAQWQALYDDAYDHGAAAGPSEEAADPTFDIRGWNSSYTGRPIPAAEMREWVERTVERILSLHPRRVLEIGCGTGLLLFRVAPHTGYYLGTDFSSVALGGIRRQLGRPGWDLPQVELRQGLAHEIAASAVFLEGGVDVVVINSVVQYFPGVDYLLSVLEGAVAAVRPGGAVFVGDVRSLPLLQAFHASTELFQAEESMPVAELRRRIVRRRVDEEELAIDPRLFLTLARRLPAIRRVELRVKRARWRNELSRFRYDVVLRVGEAPGIPEGPRLDGRDRDLPLAAVERLLADRPETLEVAGLANARLAGEAAALDLLAGDAGGVATAGDLRRAVAERAVPGIDPEDLALLGERLGYEVSLTLDPAAPFHFGAVFSRRGAEGMGVASAVLPEVPDLPWSALANDPQAGKLARRLVPELRRFLAEELPDYMVPASFVLLDRLPLTAHGKVDRAALPEPELVRPAAATAPPRTPVERSLAALWREVLGVEEIGREDGFFELGGHSLLATQLVSRVRESFGVELPLRALFEAPTIAALAGWIERERPDADRPAAPPLRRAPRDRPLPLSFAQERLWFLHLLAPQSPVYNVSSALRLDGPLDVAALAAALSEICRRHEALRTGFRPTARGAVQEIHPWRPLAALPVIDLSGLPEEAREAEARRIAEGEAARPFDLGRETPLLRALLARLAADRHVAVWSTHHIVSDGWSILSVFTPEVGALYAAFAAGRPSPLPELPVQYADYAVWQREWLRGPELARQIAWWRESLAGLPPLELPADRPRPAAPSGRGGSVGWSLPAGPAERLRRLAAAGDATPFMALFAGFAAALHRQTGALRLPVSMPVAGRSRVELEGLIGFFVNTLVLRGDLDGDPAFPDLLARAREAVLGALDHQDLPFERVVEELDLPRNPYRPPLLRVVLQLQGTLPSTPSQEAGGLAMAPFEREIETAKFDLSVQLFDDDGAVSGSLSYDADLFDPATVARLGGHFAALAEAWVEEPDRRLSELPRLSGPERHQLLAEWNPGPGIPLAEPVPLHRLFEAWADRTSDAPALTAGGETLSYAELDRRANRLARHLWANGVRPGDRVALLLERSAEMVVALLAVLKAGAAYVPVDPAYPEERIAYILADSGASLVLTAEALETAAGAIERRSAARLDLPLDAGFPAYAIYTSGSTGRPKGVVVTHANVHRLLAATEPWFGFGPDDVWTLFHSYAFDFSVWEIWGALLHGGRLVVVPFWESRSPEDFYRLLRDERVTVLNQTPSAFRQLLWAEEAVLGGAAPDLALRYVIFGGEALEPASLAPWLARHGDDRPRLINMYGITETTVHVTWRPVRAADLGGGSRIGAPIPDLAVHLLDADLQLQPIGVPGEIHVGGAGLALGYLGRPDLTAERFVPNPFSELPGARLYRSGDLARRLPDGDLEYLGRIDHQVKIRGFRIELGEIEAVLAAQPGVREVAVLAREGDHGGERRLIAYVAGAAADPAPLRQALAERLPDYMIPSAFVFLEALPLTGNGKVDRRVLPAPDAPAPRAPVPPRTPLESFLAGQIRDVLGLAGRETGVHDDFFELGGTSITGAIFIHRLQETLGEIVHVVAIFDHPTVASLADYVREQHAGAARRIWGEGAEGGEEEAVAGPAELVEIDRLIAAGRPAPAPNLERMDEPLNPPALFVLAPPRSGTTLLRVMLGSHPGLFSPPELEMLSFRRMDERRDAFQGRDAFWLEGLIRAVMEARGVDAAEAERIVGQAEREGWTTRRFYRELQGWLGGRMLVDKTPSYALDPEILRRAEEGFAGARYLHLVRDPRAANLSFVEAKLDQIFFRRPHPFTRHQLAELVWTASHRNILGFLAGVPSERWLEVRFEELVREPERVLRGVCEFLGITYRPEMADPYRPGSARMVDGPHQVSRMLGDVKFLGHGRVDARAADRWRDAGGPPLGAPAREIARRLGYDTAPARGVLVPLQQGSPGRPPLFCVHPVGGEVVAYRELARRLGPDQPVYGLQSPDPPLEDVREMAERYLEAVREVQPEGPYRIAGWSMGGVVAYEMARRLESQGETVDVLALIDVASPARWTEQPPPTETGMVSLFAADLAALHGVAVPPVDLSALSPDAALRAVLDLGRQSGLLPPGLEPAELRRLFGRFRANRRALSAYGPSPYAGRVDLFRAESRREPDPTLGWGELLDGGLRVSGLPGDHYSILREEVGALAGRLRKLLD